MTPNTVKPISEKHVGKHVPERTCAACRRKRPQGEFVRLSQDEHGWAFTTGVRTGRGVYLCADSPSCWAEKRLRRAFGASAARVSDQLIASQPLQRNGMSNSS